VGLLIEQAVLRLEQHFQRRLEVIYLILAVLHSPRRLRGRGGVHVDAVEGEEVLGWLMGDRAEAGHRLAQYQHYSTAIA